MASAVGNIHVNLLVNTGSTRSFTSAANLIGRDSDRMRRALGGTNTSVHALRASMSQGMRSRIFSDMIRQASQTNNEVAKLRASMMGLAAITGTSLTGAFAGTFLLQTADQANRLNNQLRTVTDSEENLVGVRERLYAISQLSRSDMAATVTLYARLSRAAQEFGASQADIVRVTETIQKAFAIGGASQAEAQGAAIQLSQGIASDRFSGEEYRSVSENAPVLLQQMARHLGVTIGKLREMAHAGELTGKVVTEAILGASDAIDADFNKTITTVGQGLTKVGNAFLMYIGDVDASLGVTQRMAAAMGNLAENMDKIAPIAASIGGLGLAAFAGRSASNAVGGRISNFQDIRRENQANLESLVKQKLAVDAQIASNQANLSLQRQQHLAIVSQGHAANVTAKQRHQASLQEAASLKEIIALRQRSLMLSQQQVAVIGQVVMAQRRATAAAAAMAMLQRAGGGLLSMLGGWTGVAFTAAIAAIGIFTMRAAEGEERSRKLTDELHNLGLISDATAGHVEGVAESIETLTADALRNKVALIATEIERLQKLQNPLEQLFSYDGQALGNIRQEIRGRSSMSDMQEGGSSAFLLRLMREVEAGAKSSADAIAELDARASLGNTTAAWDDWASRLRVTFELLDGHIQHVDMLQDRLDALSASGISTGWVDAIIAQSEALAATQGAADALHEIAAEQVAILEMTEEETRLRKIMDDLRKEAVERGAEEASIQEAVLRFAAQQVLAAEDLAAKRKEAAEAQEDFNKKVGELSTEIAEATSSFEDMEAAATIERLLKDFSTGNMKAETLKQRLEEVNSVNLSDPMDALIAKIIAAIGPLATLLGIFNSFGGASPLGGDLAGPARPGGALGRSRRELAAKQVIGQGILDSAVADAGMSERDAWIKDKTEDLKKQAEAIGGVATNAEATAATLWEMDQAQKAAEKSGKSAADAAEKYAEGMAELNRELAAAPLDPFLKEVLASAESMGIATDELDAFVAAVSSGGIDAAPEKFRAIAAAMQEIKAIDIMQNLQFEGEQMFRSDTEQNVYATLRDAGIDVASAQGEMIAGQIRFNERLQEARDIALGFTQDFRSALMEGKSFWEALGIAGANALDKIASKALDMAVNGIFDMIFGAVMGGVTGGIGGGFSSSITGSGGGFFPGLTGPSLMSFAGGGDTGNGLRSGGLDGMGGFLAMLHPKETVIDRTVSSLGNAGLSDAANPAITIYNTMQVMPGATEEDGAAFARGVSKELRRQLPDAIQSYNRNPLRRSS